MTVKEFLETSDQILLKGIAKEMYPGNADSASYLTRKLKGTGRPWTGKDSILAKAALDKLAVSINDLTID